MQLYTPEMIARNVAVRETKEDVLRSLEVKALDEGVTAEEQEAARSLRAQLDAEEHAEAHGSACKCDAFNAEQG